MKLRFATVEDANAFSKELGGPTFETLEEARLFEFMGQYSKELEDRIKRRVQAKDIKKSIESKKQQASLLGRDQLSRSLKKFNQTAKGKRLRQRVQQMRKDGMYRKYETVTVLSALQGALFNEARYNRELVEELHTELCVEHINSLLEPVITAVMEESITPEELVVLMNLGELAESIDTLLNIDESISPYVHKIVIDCDDDDTGIDDCLGDDEDELQDETDVSVSPSMLLSDVSESVVSPGGHINEAYDLQHGQVSTRTFESTAGEGELRPGVLDIVTGPTIFLDSISRNNRFYSAKVWENAVADEEFQQLLKSRMCIGTIGHDVELDENAVRNGLISHIVTDVRIDPEEKVGYATYEILDTESGRTLKTMIDAGMGIKTSTRAYGCISNERFEGLPEGCDVIDPNDFHLKGIDFVISPGFLGAEPTKRVTAP